MYTEKSAPKCPRYHATSDLWSKPGYYPNLSDAQQTACELLDCKLSEERIVIDESDGEIRQLKLLRFLRARGFNVNKAFDMLKEDCRWRIEQNMHIVRSQSARELLQCDLETVYRYFPTWLQGYDYQYRPVAWRQFGKFEIWSLLQVTTMERLVRFHAWESEQAIRKMREKSDELHCNIETFVIIIDAAGWSLRLATGQAMTFIKGMAMTDSAHYPERLGKLIVINAPAALAIAWRIISTFLDDIQRAKIKILADKKEWFPVLLETMDISQIPRMYGGEAPDYSAEEAFRSLDPPQMQLQIDGKSASDDSSPSTEYSDENVVSATMAVTSSEALHKSPQRSHFLYGYFDTFTSLGSLVSSPQPVELRCDGSSSEYSAEEIKFSKQNGEIPVLENYSIKDGKGYNAKKSEELKWYVDRATQTDESSIRVSTISSCKNQHKYKGGEQGRNLSSAEPKAIYTCSCSIS